MSYNKWILGGLGFALTSEPVGALVGFVIGAFVDGLRREEEPPPAGPRPGPQYQATAGDLALNIVVLTAAVMRADGRTTQNELGHVRRFFAQQFGPHHSAELLRLLRDVLRREVPLGQVCDRMRMRLSYPERLQVLHYLIGLANADGRIDPAERDVLQRIATYLGISEKDLSSLDAMFRPSVPAAAYQVLEVDAKASDEEVKKAYRRAVMKHHPDKVAHLGEEFQKQAADRFKKVQDAWERIQRERGLA